MSGFRTVLSSWTTDFKISYSDSLLSLGSCFAEHIGRRLEEYKFNEVLNPFGILYNPISICQGLSLLLEERELSVKELFQHQSLWHHFAFHSRFSHPDREAAFQAMKTSLREGCKHLAKADVLFLTFGTSYIFELEPEGQVVANCHKLPGDRFRRRRLSVDEVVHSLAAVLRNLRQKRPRLQVVCTVSPVRHVRDGLIGNQRSKAILLLAVEALESEHDFVHYFPSYELVQDDLRDYRFFEPDLVHPNATAVDYVWDFFCHAFFDEATRAVMQRVGKLRKAVQHRAFHPESERHQAFLRKQIEYLESLEKDYPFLDFSAERGQLTGGLAGKDDL